MIKHHPQLEYTAVEKQIIVEKTHEILSKNIQNKEIKKERAHHTMSQPQAKRKIKRARVAAYLEIFLNSINLGINVEIKLTTITTITISMILMT